ncbi:Yip1 family protein [Marinilabilia salmonicolor]|uniref:Yip1 family protein n=1 Tax=Marinilabilia salmonicolor TaxID=989 RepID=UPI00029B333B|nr:Yip1 family protein [Marinilabilia salmonicolor]
MEAKQPVNTIQMYRNLGERIKGLVVSPGAEWQKIHRESTTFNDILGNFALPLIGLVALGTFLSHMINQQAFIFEFALKKAIMIFTALFGGTFLSWFLVYKLMKYFRMVTSRELAAKLTIYSSAPLYVVSLVSVLIPEFFFVHIFVLYSLYLCYIGVRGPAGPPPERQLAFAFFVFVALVIIPYLLRIVLFYLITV